jgi:hypothetical protein
VGGREGLRRAAREKAKAAKNPKIKEKGKREKDKKPKARLDACFGFLAFPFLKFR